MLDSLKKAFTGKGKDETAIVRTATEIRSRSANAPEIITLEDAVAIVIANITMESKRAAFQEELEAGRSPREAEFLIPSVLLGMVLTHRMWGLLDEKYDGGKVATYVALRHCLENPGKDHMAVFSEGAVKYNALRQALEDKGEEFNGNLDKLLVSSFGNADNESLVRAYKPLYALIREQAKDPSAG